MNQSQRIEDLFHRAADLPPDTRATYLTEQCGDDAQLRAAVEELLLHDAAGTTDIALRSPISARRDLPAAVPPKQIGSYRIISTLGEGGMGSVYEAEQLHPVKRTVALKVIKLGMDTREVIARFEAERQALAVMDHPAIARVYDAGATDTGRPYFVMELVNGVPITQFCDQKTLSTRDRLELFIKVCDAVQHAHTKGVIHRDLKPGNILVTEVDDVPSPKVIDFGIVKATSTPLTERTLQTELGQMLGTPEYMSPEQARPGDGIDVDTRSDVYSLGAVLYELLCGSQPFDAASLRSGGYHEIQRIIRDIDPPRPSTRFELAFGSWEIAARRGETLQSLSRLLRRELEWIPLMAMHKEREHRYQSAADLADDVRAYLDGRPLVAAPESRTYRARKFLRRNARVVAVAAAMILLLIAGIITTSVQAIRANREKARAEQRFEDVRALASGMLFDLQPAVNKLPGSQEATRRIVDLSKAYLEKLQAEKSTDVALIAEVASAYLRLGDIQGSANSVSSNDPKAARASWDKAAALAARAMQLAPNDHRALKAVGETEFLLADAESRSGNLDAAIQRFQRALEHYTAAAAAMPGIARRRHDVVLTQTRIASIRFRQSRIAEAIEMESRAVDDARKLLSENPADPGMQTLLAGALTDQCTMKARSGDIAGSNEALAESLRLYETLHQNDPNNSKFELSLADAYLSTAQSDQSRGDQAARSKHIGLALEHARKLTATDGTSAHLQHLMADVLMNESDYQSARGDFAAATKSLDEASAIYEKLLVANAKDRQARERLSVTYGAIGGLLDQQGKFDESIDAISKAIETLNVQANADPDNVMLQAGIAYYQLLKGLTQTKTGQLDDALATLRGALAAFERVVVSSPRDLLARRNELISRRALAEALVATAEKANNDASRRDLLVAEALKLLIATRDGYEPLIKSEQPDVQDVTAAKEVDQQIASLSNPTTQPH
jgi:eukaryotic-like serine/threonine-protein kinase